MEYGLLGKKLTHSFSKEIHSYFGDYKYEYAELCENELASFFEKRHFCGINVTVPYKKAVIPYLDGLSETAKATGSVNTVKNVGGRLYGYNTDVTGFCDLLSFYGFSAESKKAVIAGTGGTAATVKYALKTLGAKSTVMLTRENTALGIKYRDAEKICAEADCFINTTPVGMFPDTDAVPVNTESFQKLDFCVDVIYNPLKTRFLSLAGNDGIRCANGLYMLVSQAAASSAIFTNTEISKEKINAVYKIIKNKKTNIALIGMPSSGKTTVGKLLAERLNRPFYDTDEEIERTENMTVSEIFESKGEAYFRKREAEVIKRLSVLHGTVISTGGGSILSEENAAYLKLNSRVYCLDTDISRLTVSPDRPLFSKAEDLTKLYAERLPLYKNNADVTVGTDGGFDNAANIIAKEFL